MCAGEWRGLEVAIKTVLFQSGQSHKMAQAVAGEAAIASNLNHPNVVATYSHDICHVTQPGSQRELELFKFYLVQVCVVVIPSPQKLHIHALCLRAYSCVFSTNSRFVCQYSSAPALRQCPRLKQQTPLFLSEKRRWGTTLS
jgi:hypothetical protein